MLNIGNRRNPITSSGSPIGVTILGRLAALAEDFLETSESEESDEEELSELSDVDCASGSAGG